MLVSNGLGKTINMSVEDYLDITDEEWRDIICSGRGEHIEDAFYGRYADNKRILIEEVDTEFLIISEEVFLNTLEEEELKDFLDLDISLEDNI